MKIEVICAALSLAACGLLGSDMPRYDEPRGDLPGNVRQVCGGSAIWGRPLPAIREGACGIRNPVEIYQVAGVALPRGATVDCDTAASLAEWIAFGAQPAAKAAGKEPLVEMEVAASYACRSRNNQSGAKMSEHALGNAIDLSAFTFADGETVRVEEDWRGGLFRKSVIKRFHEAACGPFGTVLGPDADRFHRDHLHFDTARYPNGTYCR
ncbi:extensin family protein [Paracoccaceae bacterium GXU_MW_L88]